MRISYFIVGLIFLLNPNYGIIDVSPDLIGYFFLAKSIEHSADLYEYLADAKQHIVRLTVISLFKIASIALCEVTDETFVLVLTFTFAIIESIYIFAAFIKLYDGISYSAMRLNIQNIADRASKLKVLTLIFFVVRNVFSVLPELTSLLYSHGNVLANPELAKIYKRNLSYLLIPIVILVAIILTVIVGRFLLDCKKSMYCTIMERIYEIEFADRYGLFRSRKLSSASFCISIAVLFSFDFHYKMMDIIPDAGAALMLLVATLILTTRNSEKFYGMVLFLAYSVSSVLNIRTFYAFDQNYDISNVFYSYVTTEKYRDLEIFTIFELLFGICFFTFVLVLLYKNVKAMTESYAQRLFAINPDECALDFSNEVKRSMGADFIFVLLHFAAKLVYVLVLPYSSVVTVLSTITTLAWSLHLSSLFSLIRHGLGDKIKDF